MAHAGKAVMAFRDTQFQKSFSVLKRRDIIDQIGFVIQILPGSSKFLSTVTEVNPSFDAKTFNFPRDLHL